MAVVQANESDLVISRLRSEHAAIEVLLDKLIAALDAGEDCASVFSEAAAVLREHYRGEDPLFDGLPEAVARKMRGQHEEALEIAARVEEALAAGQDRDAVILARRFHAIAQHNIIEEERDVFPLMG